MWFGKKNAPLPAGVITTSEGLELEVVTSYEYLGVWLDSILSFSQNIPKLQAKVKSRLGFLYRNCSSFTPAAKLTLIDDHPSHARLRRQFIDRQLRVLSSGLKFFTIRPSDFPPMLLIGHITALYTL